MIWEFPYTVMGQRCDMVFTSVTGHVMGLDFPPSHRGWNTCNPRELIDGARVVKQVDKGKEKVAENLRKEASRCAWLILWLDCDREGENIAFEVMDICKQSKPGIRCLRARFSALSHNDVTRALAQPTGPEPAREHGGGHETRTGPSIRIRVYQVQHPALTAERGGRAVARRGRRR